MKTSIFPDDTPAPRKLNENLYKNWLRMTERIEEHLENPTEFQYIRFAGTIEDFEAWKKTWHLEVPKCPDFVCCHELDSCGISRACGQCSRFGTMSRGVASDICEDVDCIDCVKRHECMYGRLDEKQRKKYDLSFIEIDKRK
jgi:hypothetical protein